MKEKNLTEGNVLKTLLVFSVPFLIANILQSLYGAVDLFVVGRYCGAESVAAVSTGTQVTLMPFSIALFAITVPTYAAASTVSVLASSAFTSFSTVEAATKV